MRRGLDPRVSGHRIVAAGGHPSAKFAPAAAAAGATVTGVGRRGKYLLVALDDDRELVIHVGLTGVLAMRDEHDPDEPYVRAWWRLDDGATLVLHDVRRFGRVGVVPAGEHDPLPTLAALGPEPFDDAFTAEHLHAALRASNIRVKTQLLSQRPVAGVGNIYADESLWRAGVHPAARTVTRPQAARLRDAIVATLTLGIDNGGTTLRDYRGFDGATGSNQTALDCYGRAGEPCRRCGTPLRRRVVDARGTTFCPVCQRR